MKDPINLNVYLLQINKDSFLVILKNGTFAELDTQTNILTSTGEAISPDELPSFHDSSWNFISCYPDESIVL